MKKFARQMVGWQTDNILISESECLHYTATSKPTAHRPHPPQAQEASKAYYVDAEKMMTLQVLALLVATGIFVTAHSMKIFTTVGSSTPLIPAVTTVRHK